PGRREEVTAVRHGRFDAVVETDAAIRRSRRGSCRDASFHFCALVEKRGALRGSDRDRCRLRRGTRAYRELAAFPAALRNPLAVLVRGNWHNRGCGRCTR